MQEAEAAYQAAFEFGKRLAKEHPDVVHYQSRLAASFFTLGNLYGDTGRVQEAENAYRSALAIQKLLAKRIPTCPTIRTT